MRLPNGQTIPDQVGGFFQDEHSGLDLHPEFRPWAQRHYYNIVATAPVDYAPDPTPAVRITGAKRPIAIQPQTPENGGM